MKTVEKKPTLNLRKEGEAFRDYFLRVRREEEGVPECDELAPELEEKVAAIDRIVRFSDRIREQHGMLDDSTELLRREREARSKHLAPWNE